MRAQIWMQIAWPAFLVAGLLELLVFALVDPQGLHWFSRDLDLPRQAIYTLAFFAFWGLTMLSSALTMLLCESPQEISCAHASTSASVVDGTKVRVNNDPDGC